MATESQRREGAGRTRRRYWRRLRDPLDEWWPKGWLLLAALFVLFFIGTFVRAPYIQRDVQAAVIAALTDAGFEVADVDASGQRVIVRLSAVPDPQRVLAQARAVARGTECSTWLGPLICPTRIHLLQVPIEPDPAANSATTGPDRRKVPRYHDLALTRTGGRLQVSGEVDSEDSKLWVLARIRSAYSSTEEALSVTGATATPMFRSAVNRGLGLLVPVLEGSVRWENGTLALEAKVLPTQLAAARTAYAAVEPALNPQPAQFTTVSPRERCKGGIAGFLEAASISFASASSEIQPASADLLDRLAALAGECPGDLIVEGHTDDSGAAPANRTLSRRRAEAVRGALIERGVSGSRLRAEGYGESQPIADNTTSAGRASNRRIVIRLDR